MSMTALGPARGGRKPAQPSQIEIVRELGEGDLVELNGARSTSTPATLVSLRHGHHMLAQALAKGMKPGEASLVTGYSSSRISVLQTDPAFKELLAHYKSLADSQFVDVLERMKQLGLSSMEELQERLDLSPESFSHGQLMDLTELMLVKGQGKGGGGPQTPGPTIEVKFISAPQAPEIQGRVIDG